MKKVTMFTRAIETCTICGKGPNEGVSFRPISFWKRLRAGKFVVCQSCMSKSFKILHKGK